jgi:hypothetical protein
MEKAANRQPFFVGGSCAPLWLAAHFVYRLLNVRCSFGTSNPVGVKDIKQAVSTPAYNTVDTNRNPVGVTGNTKKAAPNGAAFSSSVKPTA